MKERKTSDVFHNGAVAISDITQDYHWQSKIIIHSYEKWSYELFEKMAGRLKATVGPHLEWIFKDYLQAIPTVPAPAKFAHLHEIISADFGQWQYYGASTDPEPLRCENFAHLLLSPWIYCAPRSKEFSSERLLQPISIDETQMVSGWDELPVTYWPGLFEFWKLNHSPSQGEGLLFPCLGQYIDWNKFGDQDKLGKKKHGWTTDDWVEFRIEDWMDMGIIFPVHPSKISVFALTASSRPTNPPLVFQSRLDIEPYRCYEVRFFNPSDEEEYVLFYHQLESRGTIYDYLGVKSIFLERRCRVSRPSVGFDFLHQPWTDGLRMWYCQPRTAFLKGGKHPFGDSVDREDDDELSRDIFPEGKFFCLLDANLDNCEFDPIVVQLPTALTKRNWADLCRYGTFPASVLVYAANDWKVLAMAPLGTTDPYLFPVEEEDRENIGDCVVEVRFITIDEVERRLDEENLADFEKRFGFPLHYSGEYPIVPDLPSDYSSFEEGLHPYSTEFLEGVRWHPGCREKQPKAVSLRREVKQLKHLAADMIAKSLALGDVNHYPSYGTMAQEARHRSSLGFRTLFSAARK